MFGISITRQSEYVYTPYEIAVGKANPACTGFTEKNVAYVSSALPVLRTQYNEQSGAPLFISAGYETMLNEAFSFGVQYSGAHSLYTGRDSVGLETEESGISDMMISLPVRYTPFIFFGKENTNISFGLSVNGKYFSLGEDKTAGIGFNGGLFAVLIPGVSVSISAVNIALPMKFQNKEYDQNAVFIQALNLDFEPSPETYAYFAAGLETYYRSRTLFSAGVGFSKPFILEKSRLVSSGTYSLTAGFEVDIRNAESFGFGAVFGYSFNRMNHILFIHAAVGYSAALDTARISISTGGKW
jgi:hypothetical protein